MGKRALQEPLGNNNLEGGVGWSEEGSTALYILRRIKQETGGGQHSLGEQRRSVLSKRRKYKGKLDSKEWKSYPPSTPRKRNK